VGVVTHNFGRSIVLFLSYIGGMSYNALFLLG